MLTDKDIQKLMEVFPTKDEVATKGDIDDQREDFSKLQTSVDKYTHKADAYFQEMKMLNKQVDRHEKWINKVSGKIGVGLKY